MSRCGHVPATVLCLAVTIESRYSESRRYVRKRLHQQCGVATQLQAQWTQHTSSIPQVYHAFVCCPHCSHKKKRMQQIKKLMQRGLLDPEQEDPFSLFVASTNIRYCYYSETHKILGNTFGMCVLQVRYFSWHYLGRCSPFGPRTPQLAHSSA